MTFATAWDEQLRSFVDDLCRFETTPGDEAPAQKWLREFLEQAGFETYTWEANPERLADHPSFPDDPSAIETANRPSVAGVLEFGDPDAGRTLVLNGHVDVVPADSGWTGEPFEPRWRDGTLTARGATDMKSGLAAAIFAARHLAASDPHFDGRLVVESVVGEEEGGIGAAAAALENPYPFERDAAIVAEPTDCRPVIATEGSLMKRLRIEGRSAHAATRWHGESVLPHFERIRQAFSDLESERGERVEHPLYKAFPIPWPVCFGRLEAGRWASSVPDELTAEVRIGVAPGETVDEVEREFDERLASVVAADPFLGANPPAFERFSIQFEPAEIDPDEPVVKAVQSAMTAAGLSDTAPRGATYGADSRHYVHAGIPTVLFGPGEIQQAHFPDESIEWEAVLAAGELLAAAARTYLED
ncbi:ArgE/DapE family deacylase [Natrarchaeobaculum sulfurireducens]|uniref:Acetylornithine deacetylase/Succinyl-diaminopimelate desuccinylase n=1 Tax=Natrarchaeobaculum sulfurireducens TaxID=2044521 RepID=A0A346PJV4_9EURY|nr:ArgE/DapE family deacylase [Natrarchaeobaculum sulfurireducens]AXR79799.1 Acetylornithine deacetylase/Succinyl-diaminopimelate desuccinylase [Natrarchaeobaculum sulfurireducens]